MDPTCQRCREEDACKAVTPAWPMGSAQGTEAVSVFVSMSFLKVATALVSLGLK